MFDSLVSSAEDTVKQVMPIGGTLSNFYVRLDGSPGASNSYLFRVRKNSADTSVVCTIAGTSKDCSDQSNSVAFTAGDLISIEVAPSSDPIARTMRWTAKFAPDP
jgi:hypothetical protein